MSDEFICTVCRRARHTLRPRQSKLLNTMTLHLCNECFEGKYEPRFVVVMAGRSKGLKEVEDYIVKHRYFGNNIEAEEILPFS